MRFLLKLVGGRPAVLAVAMVGTLMMVGCASPSSSDTVTATPAFSPAGGSYNASQTVTITDATAGAVLYCTTDGSTPTPSSPQCSQPTTVFKTEFLQAMAVAPGKTASQVATAGYTINLAAAATPTFSPAGGTYTSSQTVAINDATAGANIYYTTDGTAPTSSSTLYTGPIAVSRSQVLSAIAVATGLSNSGVASATYTISQGGGQAPTVASPAFSPGSGAVPSGQAVTISDTTSGANIYYTLDGSTPSSSSTPYTAPIVVTAAETIKAIAIAGGNSSPVVSATYTISQGGGQGPSVASPIFSPGSGAVPSGQAVTISDATAGAAIYYTLDGSTPSSSSTPYTAPITVTAAETIKAIAIAGGSSSPVVSATYTISPGVTPPPQFSKPGGTYSATQQVHLDDANLSALIYYTIDGSTPSASSILFDTNGVITVSQTETINAIAIFSGKSSAVASASYIIDRGVAATPTLSVGTGGYSVAQTETITDSIPGVPIYYTLDGSTPSATNGTLYSGPFTVSATTTVQAIAVGAGYRASSVATATLTITIGSLTLHGTVFSGASGSLPIVGAQVQLYGAGQSGYGDAAVALLASSVTTDSAGTFIFSVNCPTAASQGDLVYLVATGGDTGSGPNSSLALMTALGACGSLNSNTPIIVNEVTTVAAAYALSPFMTTAPNVSSTATNYQGLTNAFKTVANLVDPATGQARTITPAYAANPVPYLNSSTVPQSRINTLANILNACVNSNGPSGDCANLFSDATPVSGTAPANTLQAILNIAQNPGRKVPELFGLALPNGPFQPMLASAPTDWTLALTFTGAGLGIAPGTTVTSSGSIGNGAISNTGMALDAKGDIWITASSALDSQLSSMIAKFDNLGAPATPATVLSAATTPISTWGGFIPNAQGTFRPSTIVMDSSGNAWIASSTNFFMSEITADLSSTLDLNAAPATNIAIDGSGVVWASAAAGNPFVFWADGTGMFTNFSFGSGGAATTNGYQQPTQLTFDSTGVLWGTDNNGLGNVYQISTDGTIAYDPFYTTGQPLAVYTPLAADGHGNVYGCASIDNGVGGQSLNIFKANVATFVTIPITTTRGCGTQMVVDGLGHIFAVTAVSSPGTIDEFTTDGSSITPISPVATGYTGTSSGEAPTINPDPNLISGPGSAPATNSLAGVAVDGSGNLWILNADTGALGAPGNVLVEYVGIAAPVVTPISAAVQNAQVGVRP